MIMEERLTVTYIINVHWNLYFLAEISHDDHTSLCTKNKVVRIILANSSLSETNITASQGLQTLGKVHCRNKESLELYIL